MPAAIRVTTPNSPPLYQWIETEVIRIGSDRNNDIQIAGLAPHVATVVFRNHEYLVANRTGEPLTLGRELVASGAEAVWHDRSELLLAGQVSLALVRHEDPRPLNVDPGREMPAIDAPEKELLRTRQRRKEIACLAITALALFATACFSVNRSNSQDQGSYDKAIGAVSSLSPALRTDLSNICLWIQKGRSVEKRGDSATALTIFRQARDQLMRAPNLVQTKAARLKLLEFLSKKISAMS